MPAAPTAPPVRPFDPALTNAFLAHLAYEPGPERNAAELTRLHRAYLDRVPYENLEIQLGRPTSIDPHESARRILTGRGGYCFHLNGALAALLVSLGYDVTPVLGRILGDDERGWGRHMVLLVHLAQPPEGQAEGTVSGLARGRETGRDGSRTLIADAGLGDGFRDPFPLVEGSLRQEPFGYRLEHVGAHLWRFHTDPRASVAGVDLDVRPVGLGRFEDRHRDLSTSPESPFVQKAVVKMRRADHTLSLRGRVLIRVDADGVHETDVDDREVFCDLLTNEFGLRGLTRDDRAALWARVSAAHQAWLDAGRP